ncbi:hypothetical protein MML48_2g00002103 [Holotrichia oblita]|uniref:Uncharacterized protein n=1 Tax=Holotrichia oblita TaxID=644536 RepID=A0ACB9TJ26_HOLOL|nr:hypothetical protein MML48_2g00002103 [Holotrichia oblita]
MSRIRQLVDLAYNADPRIAKFKQEDKERKLAMKKAKQTAAQQRKEEEERILRELQEAKDKAEAEERAKLEAKRLEREAQKKVLKKERKTFRDTCKANNYFTQDKDEMLKHMQAVESICETLSAIELEELNKNLKNNGRQAFTKALNESESRIEEEKKSVLESYTQRVSNQLDVNNPALRIAEWTTDHLHLLIKAVNLFPAGTNQRWEVVANFINQHGSFPENSKKFNAKAVLAKAKDLQNTDFSKNNLKEAANKQAFDNLKKEKRNVVLVDETGISKKIDEEKPIKMKKNKPENMETLNGSQNLANGDIKMEKPWTATEQQLLEQALKTYPASTPERWDRIADCVPERSKKDCMKRYKELVEIIVFSSLYEEKCPFTRDYNLIKSELQNLGDYDKTCIETAFHGVNNIVLTEWGSNTACDIILVTDGSTGIGPGSLKESLATASQRPPTNAFPLPFAFPAKLHIVCVAASNDPSLIKSKPLYQELIDISGYEGSVLLPENQLNETSVCNLFQKLAEDMYTSFRGVLKCGNLESKVILSPAPVPYTKITDFDYQTYNLSDVIDVCGFISVADVGSPMAISRHLILPAGTNVKENPLLKTTEIDLTTDDDTTDEGRMPSFCVLLHGALKVENMAALVTISENWFGFIYSWADSKKKSNLMLTILMPGSDSVPWLGDLNYLHCADNFSNELLSSFPVRPTEKRSYSQNSVVWIRQAGLQSDIQKILRHARKLPEKTQQFYKVCYRYQFYLN